MSHLATIETLQRENGQLIEEITRLRGAAVRPAPCENLCEARAFEIEIRQLKSQRDNLQATVDSTLNQQPFAWFLDINFAENIAGPYRSKVTAELAALVIDAEYKMVLPLYASQTQPWQPIETAPTEPHSTAIIYAPSDTGEGNVGEAFLGKDGQWYWAGSEVGYHDPITDCNSPPTHWMPMPAKPKSQEAA